MDDMMCRMILMIVEVLSEGSYVGKAATVADLEKWANAFGSPFPSVVDPQRQLVPSGFPELFVVDTRTMVVRDIATGPPSEAFWQTVEAVLTH
jgi:hypothetical protein